MRVFVTGATGFIGRALIPRLQRDGHAVVAWVRSPARARGLLGADVEIVHADTALDGLVAAIERCDAVVNLAGEPLMGGRWTAARRAVLEKSRIAVTEQLVHAMAEAKPCPRVFMSGQRRRLLRRPRRRKAHGSVERRRRFPGAAVPAVGECGPGRRAAGCARRAAANRRRAGSGRRRAGADAAAVPVGSGGPRRIGQAVPAVDSSPRSRENHRRGAGRRRYRGPVNGVAPEQATSRTFARASGARFIAQPCFRCRRLRSRRSSARRPSCSWRASVWSLGSSRSTSSGSTFRPWMRRSRTLSAAPPSRSRPRSRDPKEPGGSLRAAGEDCDRCAGRRDVRVLLEGREPRPDHTGGDADFPFRDRPPPMATGAVIDYRVRVGPPPVRWRTRITTGSRAEVCRPSGEGPVPLLVARHTFQADGPRTVMEDRVYYTPPLGLLGRLANRVFIRSTLRKIFSIAAT